MYSGWLPRVVAHVPGGCQRLVDADEVASRGSRVSVAMAAHSTSRPDTR